MGRGEQAKDRALKGKREEVQDEKAYHSKIYEFQQHFYYA